MLSEGAPMMVLRDAVNCQSRRMVALLLADLRFATLKTSIVAAHEMVAAYAAWKQRLGGVAPAKQHTDDDASRFLRRPLVLR